MKFEKIKENCEGYEFKKGTSYEHVFNMKKCTPDEQNKHYDEIDSFQEIYFNTLCLGEDGKMYAVQFGGRNSETQDYDPYLPYIWQEVEKV